jgi:hypothetical protein
MKRSRSILNSWFQRFFQGVIPADSAMRPVRTASADARSAAIGIV